MDCWSLVKTGTALGPGLFPEAVQKMRRGLDPPASRDYCSAQPQVGRQVPLLETSYLLYIFSFTFTKPVQCGHKAASGKAVLNAAWFCNPWASPLPSSAARVQAAFLTAARQPQSEKLFLSIGLYADVVQLPCPNREGS